MVANTGIEWAHHTFNPWEGCQKVGPGCDHCYAETRNARFGGGVAPNWGPGAPRRRTSTSNWQQPRRWNREAAAAGVRYRVFCSSLADVLDPDAPDGAREDLWPLVEEATNLDWLFLTKRIGNARKMLPARWLASPQPNVWLGATVVNQAEADRDIPKLLATPAAKRFLSMEPLLGPVDFNALADGYEGLNALTGLRENPYGAVVTRRYGSALDWIIVGGESGPGARPMPDGAAQSIVDQCLAAGVPVLVKQLGSAAKLSGKKGGDMAEWPESLRVRQVPA
jgi:protein gp37